MNVVTLPRRRLLGAWGAPVTLFVAYVVAIVLLVVSSIIDFDNARALEETNANVARTIEAQEKLRTIGNTIYVAESSQLGYLLTGNAAYLDPFRLTQQRIEPRMDDAGNLISNTPSQRAGVARLRELVQAQFAAMQATIDAYRVRGQPAALAVFEQGNQMQTMIALRELIAAMLDEESRLLGERRAVAAQAYSSAIGRALVATIVVGLALTAFYFLMHRYLRERDAALEVVEANNAVLERRVVERTTELAQLSRHLLEVRELEKKAIARDLHDDFGSYLTAINMDVSRARDKIAATHPEQAAKLERTLGLLNSAIELKRQLISELRPSLLDNLGLGPALEQYVEEWGHRAGVQATFDHDGDLTSDAEGCAIAIFRVFQEALSNIAKHANATRVAASCYRAADSIEFEIADDGIGLVDADRTKSGSHGLLGMRERVLAYGGRVDILPGPQGGTIVRGAMPCTVTALDPAGAPATT